MIDELTLSAEALHELASRGRAVQALPTLVAGQRSIRLLRLMDAVRQYDPADQDRRLLDAAVNLLLRTSKDPEVFSACLAAPETGLWIARGLGACRTDNPWGEDPVAALCAIAATAGIRAGLDFELEVPLVNGLLVLPGLGLRSTRWHRTATVLGGAGRWRIRLGGVTEPSDGHDRLTPLGLTLRKPGGRSGLEWSVRVQDTGKDARTDQLWRLRTQDDTAVPEVGPRPANAPATIRAAWELLADRHESFARDLALCVTDLIPLCPAPSTSASSPHAYGAIWANLARTPVQLAASLVHECQHSVLTAVHDLVPLHSPDARKAYRVAWHAEPRTINALLHGLYAHTALAEFWYAEGMHGTAHAAEHRDRLLSWCEDAVVTARSARGLSRVGVLLVEGTSWRLAALSALSHNRPGRAQPDLFVMDSV
jgi:uncharacterized protein